MINQQAFGQSATSPDYAAAFKRLYYELYSNSSASRAERIIEDLSKILLCKLACDRAQNGSMLRRFLAGEGTANSALLGLLTNAFPSVVSETDTFSIGDDAVRRGLESLLPYDLGDAPAHIIGDAFQALMGPRLRGDKGQFFTPRSLVRVMVEVLAPPPSAKVVDPACGTGGFLTEVHAYQAQSFSDVPTGSLIGIDKDQDMWRLASALLAISSSDRAVVLNQDSLDLAGLSVLETSLCPFDADFVLTNPPFGSRIGIDNPEILSQFALGYTWLKSAKNGVWEKTSKLRRSQDPQILFIELCVELLKPGGRLGIVLPEGVFGNRQMGYVWDYLRARGEIIALIDCPRTTFQPSTDTKTNVLFFETGRAVSLLRDQTPQKVWMAVALHCGHDRRGRMTTASGESYPDDFERIGQEFEDRERAQGVWSQCEITQAYYVVPRYYEKPITSDLCKYVPGWNGGRLLSIRGMTRRGYLTVRKGHEVGSEAYGTGDIPFVRTSDISNWEVSVDTTKSISEEIYQEYAPLQNLKPGDILIVVDGRYRIGRTAILQEHNYKCVIQSHCRIITVENKAPFDPYELLYLLNTPFVQRQIRNLVFIQSTLGSLGKRLGQLQIPLPTSTEEWKRRVDDFRISIQERARLLEYLASFQVPEVEL